MGLFWATKPAPTFGLLDDGLIHKTEKAFNLFWNRKKAEDPGHQPCLLTGIGRFLTGQTLGVYKGQDGKWSTLQHEGLDKAAVHQGVERC